MGLDARQKDLIRAIAAIAFPAIVTNITVPLLGLCDIAIAGHKGGAAFIASLAVATSMFNMVYWLFGFLRMGSSGLTARAFGASDFRTTTAVLIRAVALALAAGALIIILRQPILALLLDAMDVDGDLAAMATRYFMITVWGAPALLATYALTGWFLGMQNSRTPMAVSIAADLVNILASVILVFGFDMTIEGVAAGTLIAQWSSLLLGAGLAVRRYRGRLILPSPGELARGGIGEFFRVNSDIFLRTLCLVAVTLWFTRTGAMQGAVMLAVNALLMQLFTIFSYFMDGFAFSAEALVGRYKGSGEELTMKRVIRLEIAIGAAVAAIFTLAYFAGGELFLGLLTDDGSVVRAATDYLPWAVTVPLAGFMAFSCDGIYIGAGRTRMMLLSMAIATAIFFLLYMLLFPSMANHGLWLAFVSYLATRGLLLLVALRAKPKSN